MTFMAHALLTDLATKNWNAEATQAAESERINHPAHYQFPNGVEVIDLVEHLSFNRGNAVKYLCRAGKKTTSEELDDLYKARWYCDREIQRIRNAQALVNGEGGNV